MFLILLLLVLQSSSSSVYWRREAELVHSQLQRFIVRVSRRTGFRWYGIRIRAWFRESAVVIPIAMMDEGHAGIAASPRPGSSVRLSFSAAERHGHCRGDVDTRGRELAARRSQSQPLKSPTRVFEPRLDREGGCVLQVNPGRGSE